MHCINYLATAGFFIHSLQCLPYYVVSKIFGVLNKLFSRLCLLLSTLMTKSDC